MKAGVIVDMTGEEGLPFEALAAEALQQALFTDPERVFLFLEREQERRHIRELLSLWISGVLLLLFGGAALLLGLNDHDWLAGIVFSTTVLGVGTIFVLRLRPDRLQWGPTAPRSATPASAASES